MAKFLTQLTESSWWRRHMPALVTAILGLAALGGVLYLTVAVNVVVMVEMFYLLNCRSLSQSMFRIGVFSNRWLIVGWLVMAALQLLFTYTPVMNELMSSAPIGPEAWARVVGWGLITFFICLRRLDFCYWSQWALERSSKL